jgi:hypothetical protein
LVIMLVKVSAISFVFCSRLLGSSFVCVSTIFSNESQFGFFKFHLLFLFLFVTAFLGINFI